MRTQKTVQVSNDLAAMKLQNHSVPQSGSRILPSVILEFYPRAVLEFKHCYVGEDVTIQDVENRASLSIWW